MIQTRGAIMRSAPGKWEIVDIEFDEPRQGELQLKMVASGLCHSDDHIATGDSVLERYPLIGGHEGAGIVEKVGPNTPGWQVGDQVVMACMPACGRCRWCASGQQNLCDLGGIVMTGCRPDGTFRARVDGIDAGQMCCISTFTERTVIDVTSAVKVDPDVPLTRACMVGCGVSTGWGSAVYSGDIRPGQTVIVMGVGGVGIHAVQGAVHAGASNVVAVDPVAFKTDVARKLGATDTFGDIASAAEFARSVTNGQGADVVIITTGVLQNEHISQALEATRKGGTLVITSVGNSERALIEVPAWQVTIYQRRIQGALFGASSPSRDVPWLLDMYRRGQLRLDEVVTTTYSLDQINEGYADMHAGKNMRGVLVY